MPHNVWEQPALYTSPSNRSIYSEERSPLTKRVKKLARAPALQQQQQQQVVKCHRTFVRRPPSSRDTAFATQAYEILDDWRLTRDHESQQSSAGMVPEQISVADVGPQYVH